MPVSGTAKLSSEGTTVAELLGNLNGHIDLKESQPSTNGTGKSRRTLSMVAKRLPDGVQADISKLELGNSELAGSITYRRTTPASLDIELHSGNLSLLPWETGHEEVKAAKKAKKTQAAESGIGAAASASASFVGRVLLTPVRLLTGPGEPEPGERMFSESPLPLDALNKMNVTFKGQMEALESTMLTAKGLRFDGKVAGGTLNLTGSSSQFGDGSADLELTLDSLSVPPTMKLESHFRDINKFSGKETYTQSGFISIESKRQEPGRARRKCRRAGLPRTGPGHFQHGQLCDFHRRPGVHRLPHPDTRHRGPPAFTGLRGLPSPCSRTAPPSRPTAFPCAPTRPTCWGVST